VSDVKLTEAKRIRRKIEQMTRRWMRDSAWLTQAGLQMFDRLRGDPATEVYRNLETAIGEAQMFLGATDEYIAERSAQGRAALQQKETDK